MVIIMAKSIVRNQDKVEEREKYIEEVMTRLKKIIPPGKFKRREPYKVLIRTILSQRSKDENTDIAAENLFSVYDPGVDQTRGII